MPSRLKSSLADLDNVAPDDGEDDFLPSTSSRPVDDQDDEDNDEEDDSEEGSEEEEEETTNRDHYEEVGPSIRRKKANLTEESSGTLDQGKYKGQDAKWSDMDQDDEEDDDDDESISSGSGDDFIDGDNNSEDDDEEEDDRPAKKSSKKSVRFDSTKDTSSGPQTLLSSLSSQSQLMSTMRDQAQEDARKGKAIKEQIAFWQKTLENRIRLEKILGSRGIGKVQPSAMSDLVAASSSSSSSVWALTASLLDHSAALLETQAQLLLVQGEDDGLEMDDDLQTQFEEVIVSSKRKRDDTEEEEITREECLKRHRQQLSTTLAFGSEILQPFTTTTLNSQSLRSSSSSSASRGGDSMNKFNSNSELKAFDQSIPKQIQIAMSGDNGTRLVDRSKKYRGQGNRIGSRVGQEDDDVETFDDSDFYSSLLRSLIECIR